ncbi:phage major capsid protein [Streptomyces cadmiisoli]|uniref:Phage major capsid protein n=1 Tax=Streptomyces cadmiisoli TaxID=2184053 RepID=A0A2Z4J6C7_9ACTN|nr:phage major capsid protein [Streptomyces cadmiisoli]AWW40792.1 phage major capsid protein [Streptomyces cadmiisoli]
MSFVNLARKSLEARGRLFEEYKSVLDDTKITDADKRERLERLDAAIEAKTEEVRDFTAKAEAEAEARNLDGKLGKLFVPGTQEEGREAPGMDARSLLLAVANGEIREGLITPDMEMRAPGGNVQAAAGKVSDAAFAGNTTSVQFIAQVQEVMREHSPFLNLVSTFTTSHGETIRYPVKNAWMSPTTDVTILPEGEKYTFGKGGFTTKDLTVAKYGTGVQLSAELLTDSEVDIAAIAADDAGQALSDRITADMLAKLQVAVPVGKKVVMVGAAATTKVSYDNLIDVQHNLRTGYRRNAAWMFGDLQLAELRKIKDTAGNPIWNPSYQVGAPDTLLGKPYVTDATITAKATGAGGTINTDLIWYGDFSKFKLRQVKGITVSRSDEYAWDSDMVSWKLTWRGGGDLMDLESVAALRTAAA